MESKQLCKNDRCRDQLALQFSHSLLAKRLVVLLLLVRKFHLVVLVDLVRQVKALKLGAARGPRLNRPGKLVKVLEALDLCEGPVAGRDLDHLRILCPERKEASEPQQVRVEEPGLTEQVQGIVGHRRPCQDPPVVRLAPDLDCGLRALGVPVLDGSRFVNHHQGPVAVDKRVGYLEAAVKGQRLNVHDEDLERLHWSQQQVVALLELRIGSAVPVCTNPLDVVRHVLWQLLGHPVPIGSLVA